MARSQRTNLDTADDWVREEVRAALRGEEVAGYPYGTTGDLDDALAVFAQRQADYAASIASGVRRLEALAHRPDQRARWTPSPAATVGKRIFDLLLGSLALVLLSPLIAVIAIAIKLDSPGSPILFRGMRVGRDGQTFALLKFRTMVAQIGTVSVEEPLTAGLFKVENDPRITRVGRFLRRLSLDELPELVNVLRGDMSLVGPRPLVVEEVVRAIPDAETHPSLALKPGITGVGRITRPEVSLAESIKLEDDYAMRWSPLRDLAVLVRALARLRRPSY